jgi:hypothetical protein
MYASRDILCRRETLKVPLLSPIGTGAPPWCGDRGCRAETVPGAVFGGGALRLALRRELGWQERRLVVPFIRSKAASPSLPARRNSLRARGGEGM